MREIKFSSTRPNCPNCEMPGLTGWLNHYSDDKLITYCLICDSTIIMTERWKILSCKKGKDYERNKV